MTTTETFAQHRMIGDSLLAEGWTARQIASPTKPGSRWILTSPSRRVQLTMAHDVIGSFADLTAVHLPGSPHTAPLWRAIIHAAPVDAVLDAARTAATAPDDTGDAADRRRVTGALRVAGWTGPGGRGAVLLRATATLTNPDGTRTVTWTARGRRGSGGWTIGGPGRHVQAAPLTPVPVLFALATS